MLLYKSETVYDTLRLTVPIFEFIMGKWLCLFQKGAGKNINIQHNINLIGPNTKIFSDELVKQWLRNECYVINIIGIIYKRCVCV